jgi:hypothetical protein
LQECSPQELLLLFEIQVLEMKWSY